MDDLSQDSRFLALSLVDQTILRDIQAQPSGRSQKQIASDLGCHPRTVNRSLKRLVKAGLLKKVDYTSSNQDLQPETKLDYEEGQNKNADDLSQDPRFLTLSSVDQTILRDIQAQPDGRSQEQIASDLGYSVQTIRRSLMRIVAVGLLKKIDYGGAWSMSYEVIVNPKLDRQVDRDEGWDWLMAQRKSSNQKRKA